MSNHVKKRDYRRRGSRHFSVSRFRESRGKSFKTEEAAHAYAKANNIENYTLKNLKENQKVNKIKIILD